MTLATEVCYAIINVTVDRFQYTEQFNLLVTNSNGMTWRSHKNILQKPLRVIGKAEIKNRTLCFVLQQGVRRIFTLCCS